MEENEIEQIHRVWSTHLDKPKALPITPERQSPSVS